MLDTTFNAERHNNTHLQLPIIDYNAIYNNSLNDIMLYLKAYLHIIIPQSLVLALF